jgi:stage II sporulation protein D
LRSATAAAYLSRTRRRQPRRAVLVWFLAGALALVLAAPAGAASEFYIRGGGNGHGVGMSQYGAYGYALHGKGYAWILRHYYRGTQLGQAAPGRTVRVLLADGAASFSGATRAAGKKLKASATYTVRPNADGTLVLLTAAGKKLGTFSAPLSASGSGPLTLAGHAAYRGTLDFLPDGSGGVETVNVVALDDYVRGVISAEMPSGWAAEALKVQAVAARTYAITSDAGGAVFDLYSDTRSQMYGGVAAETPATDAAVAATRGQIVTYRGTPAITYFFASSGGHTENVENVWAGSTPEPWLRGVVDRYDAAGGDPYHRWGYNLSMTSAAAHLRGYLRGGLIGVQVTRQGVSGRVISAQVAGTRGRVTVTGSQLQSAFGLLSTLARFTTITTLPGPSGAAVPARRTRSAAHADALAVSPAAFAQSQTMLALLPVLHALSAGAKPALHGQVFPARKGERIAVQRLVHRRWGTVGLLREQRGGAYSGTLAKPGVYRVVVAGIDGPAVTVG